MKNAPFLTLWHEFKLFDAKLPQCWGQLWKAYHSLVSKLIYEFSASQWKVGNTPLNDPSCPLTYISSHEFPHRTSKPCLYLNIRWPCKSEAQKENARISWCVAGLSPTLCCTCRRGVPGTEGHCSDSRDKCS